MAKVTSYLKISGLLLMLVSVAQTTAAQYRLNLYGVDKDSLFLRKTLKAPTNFSGIQQCRDLVNRIPSLLMARGYPHASVDSVRYDSASAYCLLYVGEPAGHTEISTDSVDMQLLTASGWKTASKKPIDITHLPRLQESLLDELENTGYPFASVSLSDVKIGMDTTYASVLVHKGPLYRVDSIRNHGTAALSAGFLQQYLGILNGSIYRKSRLAQVSSKIRELPFVKETQPWSMSLMGTGSILNLYLEPKKSSEVNVLIGLLPSNAQLADNKLLVTGEANINLKNALGSGETIGLNWQQIQVKSPRLNIIYQQPYLFGSPFGMNFNFDLFKKDSSFVNIGILLGASYAVSSTQSGSIFVQRLTTNLLTVDTFQVKSLRKLPAEADVSSMNVGLNYDWVSTDYRFNPRRGNEVAITASVGTKNIRKNNVIAKLYDNADPDYNFNTLYDTFKLKSYQFRLKVKAAHYFPLTRASTLKTAINGGWFQSPSIFRNELFQIGGYRLMRGFDEESIYSSAYGVATAEYRYLIGMNSFLAAFADYGVSANRSINRGTPERFLGAGLGMAFETKAGIFNITFAAGKRDNQKFNLRQSKIHLGYVNYF